MEEIIEMLRRNWKDQLEVMTHEQIKEVSEVLDAFLTDYRLSKWIAEDVGYEV